MTNHYTGVVVVENLDSDIIQTVYKDKKVSTDIVQEKSEKIYQNQYVVLKDIEGKSAITRNKGDMLYLLDKRLEKMSVSGISPRNKEQVMYLDSLLDPSITCVAATGRAGSGKSLLSFAAALHQVENGTYNKIVIVRHLQQTGGRDTIGFLKGSLEEKISPYFMGILSNFEHLVSGNTKKNIQQFVDRKKNSIETLMDLYSIEFHPLATLRGASFSKCFLLIEESQNLDQESLLTVGTRVSEGSKIVLSGDTAQIDGPLKGKREKTGLFKFINDERVKNSNFTSSIHLLKCERGPTAMLFAEVLEQEDY